MRLLCLRCLLCLALLPPGRAQDTSTVDDNYDPWDDTPDPTRCDTTGYTQCSAADHGKSVFGNKCCGHGYESGGFADKECKGCPVGKYKNNLWMSCFACPAGKHQQKKNCNTCDQCVDTKNCAQSVGDFQPAACAVQKEKCGTWWNRKSCVDDSRLVISIVPKTWLAIAENSVCSEIELPVCNTPLNDPGRCYQPVSRHCLLNAHSLTFPPCTLMERCMSVAELRKDALGRWSGDPDQAVYVWDTDFPVLATGGDMQLTMRVPRSMHVAVQVFDENTCTRSRDNRVSHAGNSDHFVFGLSGDVFFKITHADQRFPNNFCTCAHASSEEQRVDALKGATIDSEGYYIQSCVACSAAQFHQPLQGTTCLGEVMGCADCPDNHRPDIEKLRRDCLACPSAAPARPAGETACRTCADHEYFMFEGGLYQEGKCTALVSMTVDTKGVIVSNFDEYRKSTFVKATPEAGWYRATMSSTAECVVTAQGMCKLATGQYLHGCVRSVPSNHQFYVSVYTPASPTGTQTLFSDFRPAAFTGIQRVDVIRTGTCRDCMKCINTEYLLGCLDTDEQYKITIGVRGLTHEENRGTCMSCGSDALLTDTQFLWHPQPGNCSHWPTEFSTVPYEIHECDAVLSSSTHWFLAAGCNKMPFRWWSLGRTTTEKGDRSKPETQTCSPGDAVSTNTACAIPDLRPRAPGPPASSALWWSAYHQPADRILNILPGFEAGGGTARVPYCPPGWYVDSKCAAKTPAWDAECCRECQQCLAENGLKRAKDWVACTGATAADTQSFCQRSCDKGYYQQRVPDPAGAYDECKPCELC